MPLHDFKWIRVVLKPLRHLFSIFSQNYSVHNHILKRDTLTNSRSKYVLIIEPGSCLVDPLRNEIGREPPFKILGMLERKMFLRVRH